MLVPDNSISADELFELAGVAKNVFEDKWEFVKTENSSNKRVEDKQFLSQSAGKHSSFSILSHHSRQEMMQTTVTTTTAIKNSNAESGTSTNVITSGSITTISTTSTKQLNIVHSNGNVMGSGQTSSFKDHHNEETTSEKDDDKHKAKRSRKKKRTKSNGNEATKKDLHIQWGQVEQYVFARSLGWDAVPSHGMFPLGLGDYEEKCCFTVDELFAQQQLKEYLAMQQLEESQTKAHLKKQAMAQQPIRTSPRIRKDSFDLSSDSSFKDDKPKAKSNDNSPRPKSEHERMELLKEFIDISQKRHDDSVHKELEDVRDSRNNIGCTCKPLKLDKLNVGKLKSEILSRKHLLKDPKIDVEKLKKNELINFLREVLKECPTCIAENCECVRLEIPCAGNACDCVYRPGESESCTNPFGSVTFDPEKVKAYRQRILDEYVAMHSSM